MKEIDDSNQLEKLEEIIEDLYQNHKILSLTKKELSKKKTKYILIVQDNGTKIDIEPLKVTPKKEKVIMKSGPTKPPKPQMADISPIGGY